MFTHLSVTFQSKIVEREKGKLDDHRFLKKFLPYSPAKKPTG